MREPDPWSDPPEFKSADFLGFIAAGSVRFNRMGDLVLTLVVPRDHVNEALSVREAATQAIPLGCHFEVYEPYRVDLAESEQTLRDLTQQVG